MNIIISFSILYWATAATTAAYSLKSAKSNRVNIVFIASSQKIRTNSREDIKKIARQQQRNKNECFYALGATLSIRRWEKCIVKCICLRLWSRSIKSALFAPKTQLIILKIFISLCLKILSIWLKNMCVHWLIQIIFFSLLLWQLRMHISTRYMKKCRHNFILGCLSPCVPSNMLLWIFNNIKSYF